ncbi:hypothetical protein [Peribacillus alkalitolerans]|uniref:hypothetical protein n=1 Tax=Peribacillus alkalitolerans TaxID=1550385 RepID=UPI0013D73007|nr:hypothetical protein [Peribacillus alkalitolerans]
MHTPYYIPYQMYPEYFRNQNIYDQSFVNPHDQRFFPFLPFIAGGLAGLAISPFFFNRPCCGPYGPYPGYGGFGGYPGYPPYPPGPVPYGQMPGFPQANLNNITDVNIFTR